MFSIFLKSNLSVMTVFCVTVMGLASGCASGGFKLTRQYASFVNSQNIIIRIILYILTSIVFAATMLIDAVIFNTMDFWEGRVSQGTYKYEKDGKIFFVTHSMEAKTNLKRSQIDIFDSSKVKLSQVVLAETTDGNIDVYENGKLKAKASSLKSLPKISLFNSESVEVDVIRPWSEERLALK